MTSLAGTAAPLMTQVDTGQGRAITNARIAAEALARRADPILHFVESYREFSCTPSLSVDLRSHVVDRRAGPAFQPFTARRQSGRAARRRCP